MHSFRSMSRIEASLRNARAFQPRHSQSFASRRQRLSHAKVLSTSQRFGKTTNPLAQFERLTISTLTCGHGALHRRLKLRPLIAAVGVKLKQERKGAKQGRHQQGAAVAILHVGAMHDGVHQEALRVDENMSLLAFDFLARIIAMRIDATPPFSADLTLWLSR